MAEADDEQEKAEQYSAELIDKQCIHGRVMKGLKKLKNKAEAYSGVLTLGKTLKPLESVSPSDHTVPELLTVAKVAMEELQRLASLPGASTNEIILNSEEELVQKYWQLKASLPSDGVPATPVAPADRSYRCNNLPSILVHTQTKYKSTNLRKIGN